MKTIGVVYNKFTLFLYFTIGQHLFYNHCWGGLQNRNRKQQIKYIPTTPTTILHDLPATESFPISPVATSSAVLFDSETKYAFSEGAKGWRGCYKYFSPRAPYFVFMQHPRCFIKKKFRRGPKLLSYNFFCILYYCYKSIDDNLVLTSKVFKGVIKDTQQIY